MAECKTRQTLNELLVDLFNFILYIQEKYMKEKGVPLTMYEVHLLENVSKIENNTIGNIADAMLVTKGTLSINASRLIKKGYLTKYVDKEDRRVVRVEITDKARDILKIHDEFHENLIDRALEDLNLSDNEVLNKSFESILTYFKNEYRKMSQGTIRNRVKKMGLILDIPDLYPHSLRKTSINLINNLAGLGVASSYANHTSSNVTSKHYLQKTNPMEVRNNIIQLRKKLGIF